MSNEITDQERAAIRALANKIVGETVAEAMDAEARRRRAGEPFATKFRRAYRMGVEAALVISMCVEDEESSNREDG